MVAGLQLKNSIKNNFNNIPLTVLDYVKQSCIGVLNQPDESLLINKTVSSVITAIVRRGQVHNWLQVISILIEKLDFAQSPAATKIVQVSYGHTDVHKSYETITN
jgi:transportin-1